MGEQRLLKANEVASELSTSIFTVRRLAARGVLRPVRFSERGHLRFRREDVDALLERQRIAA